MPVSLVLLTGVLALSPVAYSESNKDIIFLEESAISKQDLSAQNGKSDLNLQFQVNDSDQNALLQNNTLNNAVTGDNSISENALSGASGISTVIQNTGNQVIIQGTTMVNVLINQ
ncbi:hypothetical protein [Pseudomaricurvus sp.]|uniref:hypothetical protein n=1 Tax=Pseudomaricurvus sp. TaxID=2004510 RepID=UPI003F6DA48E